MYRWWEDFIDIELILIDLLEGLIGVYLVGIEFMNLLIMSWVF